MKKFAIMFVMLLGSVATMQAQTFDFSCYSYGDWSTDQVEMLEDNNFEHVSNGGNLFHVSLDRGVIGDFYLTIELINGMFHVYDDSDTLDDGRGGDYGTHLTLDEAVMVALGIGLPDAVEGFTQMEVFEVQSDGLIYGAHRVIGCGGCPLQTGFQGEGEYTQSGIDYTSNFVLAKAREGAGRDIHDNAGNVIGHESYSYIITWAGSGTPQYFQNVEDAIVGAVLLNTRD